MTTTGQTACCSRLAGTDVYLWSLTEGPAPTTELRRIQTEAPDFTASPGGLSTTPPPSTPRGEPYCNATVNGRNAGNLVWQLRP
ncbi:hypothetical protein [Rhodococcoides fascians]|uniref:hypothetical protein n=1 Tax=Rhodococcoides fascians TaxID=1828 RepID=UPI0011409098|nr:MULTISPECIES: hypothetical protein [Rhodococcus]